MLLHQIEGYWEVMTNAAREQHYGAAEEQPPPVEPGQTFIARMVSTCLTLVDTIDHSQGIDLPVWDSVSTHLMGRSTHSGIFVT
ncbi:hypothetical protein Taro_051869 [Colocasia esculenta]|uniref:Uncharacterized protein n=1 Tax=Colocasia esculenta TaxID=4460 RepID=A0A843XHZ6_COLES|nr:hypothetical protein [Colocasia esculenta]